MRILGLDPGLRRTGFGVIDVQGQHMRYVTSGTITAPSEAPLSVRLKTILDGVRKIAADTQPDLAAIEIVFVNVNAQSTLLLGQARGAAMCGLADSGLTVHEYTALQVKKSVVGYGKAGKEQVQDMVQRLLNLNRQPPSDPADALACAICHAHMAPLVNQLDKLGWHDRNTRSGRSSTRGSRLRLSQLPGGEKL